MEHIENIGGGWRVAMANFDASILMGMAAILNGIAAIIAALKVRRR
jgi:uncharacterized membrane protein HdeD (DUF308 family)